MSNRAKKLIRRVRAAIEFIPTHHLTQYARRGTKVVSYRVEDSEGAIIAEIHRSCFGWCANVGDNYSQDDIRLREAKRFITNTLIEETT